MLRINFVFSFCNLHKYIVLPPDAPLSSPFLKKEIKKFLRGKTLIKNFFKYKKGVSHYHFGANAHSEMIVYTFLLLDKNEKDV